MVAYRRSHAAYACPGTSTSCAPRDRFLTPRHFAHMDANLAHEHLRRAASGAKSASAGSPEFRAARSAAGKISGLCSVAVAEGGLARTSKHCRPAWVEQRVADEASAPGLEPFVSKLRSSAARFRLRHAAAAMCFPSTLMPLHFPIRSPRAMLDGVWGSHDQ